MRKSLVINLAIRLLGWMYLFAPIAIVNAQGVAQSPYAQFGFGDIEPMTNIRMLGMGGAGAGLVHLQQINLKNPAALGFNRQNVTFEAAFAGRSTWLSNGNANQNIISGNIRYLALLLPITKKSWTIMLGGAPYSGANARLVTDAVVDGAPDFLIRNIRVIEGGLNQFYLTNAFRLNKNVSVGVQTSYVLGAIKRENRGYFLTPVYNSSNQLVRHSNSGETVAQVTSQEIYRILEFKPSVSYLGKIRETNSLSVGASFTFNQSVNSRQEFMNKQLHRPSREFSMYGDTTLLAEQTVKLPAMYQLGVAYYKGTKWVLAGDYTFIDYTQYNSFAPTNVFVNAHKIEAGWEYIPNINAIRGLHKRMSYRLGAYYKRTPIKINGTQISDFAATFGVGLPVGRSGIGMLNFAFQAGQRGTLSNGLIRENYLNFSVGMNINDRWFMRYRVD